MKQLPEMRNVFLNAVELVFIPKQIARQFVLAVALKTSMVRSSCESLCESHLHLGLSSALMFQAINTVLSRSLRIKLVTSSDPSPPMCQQTHDSFVSFTRNNMWPNPKTSGWISRNKLTVFKDMISGGRRRSAPCMKATRSKPVLINL